MNHKLVMMLVLAGALASGGCATKKYVKQTTDPIQGKLDQVAEQTNKQGSTLDKQGSTLDQAQKNIEKNETDISAANERALSAGSAAKDAMDRANQAGQKADATGRDLGELRNRVANLDDYKQVADAVIPFKFNQDTLTPEAKDQLDKLVAQESSLKRYFIAVEGFTDQIGTANYNSALSRRRADRVMEYLVAKHNIPVYRVHMIGLGKDKLVDEGRTRAARAKNRRVEVTFYSADTQVSSMASPNAGNSNPVDNRQ
jgi:outer membrane protein OmpA-like peptidoglycan-associated protein